MAPENEGSQALDPSEARLPAVASASFPLVPVAAVVQRSLVDGWLAWLRRQVAEGQLCEGTIRPYTRAADAWLGWLERSERTDQPGPLAIGHFVAWYRVGRSAQTVNQAIAALHGLYRWTESTQAYPDIARATRRLRTERRQPLPCLVHAEVGQVLALITGRDLRAHRDRAMVAVAYGASLRASSLASIDVGGVDLVAGTVKHRAKGRRGELSTAYLPAGAAQLVAVYLQARHAVAPVEAQQPLWTALDRRAWGGRLTPGGILRVVARWLERAGHRRRGPDGQLVAPGVWGPHALRRSSLTRVASELGLEAACAVAQHSSIETTRRWYTGIEEDRRMRAAAGLLDLAVSRPA